MIVLEMECKDFFTMHTLFTNYFTEVNAFLNIFMWGTLMYVVFSFLENFNFCFRKISYRKKACNVHAA